MNYTAKCLLICSLAFSSQWIFAQDSLIVFKEVIPVPDRDKDKIFEQALIWCGRTIENSNYAIRVSDKAAGIISGKAEMTVGYKIPDKVKDSLLSAIFCYYSFDWLIEVKSEKLRVTFDNIKVRTVTGDFAYQVTTSDDAPVKVLMSKEKSNREWIFSKIYFRNSVRLVIDDLSNSLKKPIDDF